MLPSITRALRTTTTHLRIPSPIKSDLPNTTAIRLSLIYRAMSSTSTAELIKYEWLCVMPDQTDALPRRLAVRDKHLGNMKSLAEAGNISYGGILLDRPTLPGETPIPFAGSALILLASSKEEAIATLKADPYTANNVWDWEKAEIIPFRTAIRGPLPSS